MLSKFKYALIIFLVVIGFQTVVYGADSKLYYYEELSDIEKEYYDIIYDNILCHNEHFILPQSDNVEHISRVWSAISYDHPELFCLDKMTYDYYKDIVKEEPVSEFSCTLYYLYTKEDCDKISQNIDRISDKWLKKFDKADIITYEQVENLVRIVANKLSYYHNYDSVALNHCQDIPSAFIDRKTVCAGYAKSFKYLADKIGFETICVEGKYNGISHLWNKVKIGDKWYNLDITSADTDDEDSVDYKYILVSDKNMKGYKTSDLLKVPTASDTSLNYYVRNNLYVKKYTTSVGKDILMFVKKNNVKELKVYGKYKELNKLVNYLEDKSNIKLAYILNSDELIIEY